MGLFSLMGYIPIIDELGQCEIISPHFLLWYRADVWLLFVIAVPESDHFKAHRLLKNSETNIGYLYLTKHTYLSCNVIFHSAVE